MRPVVHDRSRDSRTMFSLYTHTSDPLSHQGGQSLSSVKSSSIAPCAHIIFSPLEDTESTWITSVCSRAGGANAASPTCFQPSGIKQFWKIAVNMQVNNEGLEIL